MNKQELYRRIEEMPYNHGIFIDTVKLSRRWLLGSISRLEEPTYDGIPALIDKINKWAISHGLDQGNPKIEWMKVTEEVGEIRDVYKRQGCGCTLKALKKHGLGLMQEKYTKEIIP